MRAKFKIDKLRTALAKDIRQQDAQKHRFFIVKDSRTEYRFICGYEQHLCDHIRKMNGEMPLDSHFELSDEADAALKLMDDDRRRAWSLLQEVAKHVSAGHYNDEIVERLRSICEAEHLHDAEAILASATSRDSQGPIEEWCMNALSLYCHMRFSMIQERRRLCEKLTR